MARITRILIGLISFVGFIGPIAAFATDYTTLNFTLKDPVIETLGGLSTSNSFQGVGAIPFISPDKGTTTSFALYPGYAAFINIILPTLSVSVSGSQAILTWTEATGLSQPQYEVGQSRTSGGPYTYDTAQAGTTAVKNSLEGTWYYVVRTKDAAGLVILGTGLSNQVTVNVVEGGAGPPPSGGGGGGPSTDSTGSPQESSGQAPVTTAEIVQQILENLSQLPPALQGQVLEALKPIAPGLVENFVTPTANFVTPTAPSLRGDLNKEQVDDTLELQKSAGGGIRWEIALLIFMVIAIAYYFLRH